MSKLTKLIKHPVLFFQDRKKNTSKQVAFQSNHAKGKTKTSKENLEVTKVAKYMFSTVVNEIPVANVSLAHYEIALYFAGGKGNIYQIEQWMNTLSVLDKQKGIVVIVRIKEVYEWMQTNTNFVVVYCRTIADLMKAYEENNFKCILYVNHGFKNFQSLIAGNALHIHINHGESDKTSTITNQSKAYDYVFIVGDAAYDKYRLNLIKKNMDNFIQVGRPQLDHIEKIAPFDIDKLRMEDCHEACDGNLDIYSGTDNEIETRNEYVISKSNVAVKKVILYAPTWEGTHDSMNFTSLDDYGMSLVKQLVEHPEYYLVYRPHPNTGSRVSSTKNINNAIIKLLKSHRGGEVALKGDINSLYEHVDLAIFDNSAVAIDYLQVDKPMIMTDMFHRIRDRQGKPTITKAARLLASSNAYNVLMIVKDEIDNDTLKSERNIVKKYFLGDFDYTKKESTDKFISTIFNIIDERDKLFDDLEILNKNCTPIVEQDQE